jgi:hypothetical protein
MMMMMMMMTHAAATRLVQARHTHTHTHTHINLCKVFTIAKLVLKLQNNGSKHCSISCTVANAPPPSPPAQQGSNPRQCQSMAVLFSRR